ncbi:hypothetical protein BO86DRAFT_420208 [Aspergillus japonicus CBS 114.51]|uniref:Outer spore wall protein RRT8 n=2 Tax=Aspergillus TaxID=5052 RepID=A0A2V5GX61_ASPV1|nr:hypothetical protein BO86DRAFT_420208 [Aspergillus japonicus CBS 114.51]PYI12833.1 hypothetical protein BO99DRAFT_373480 [Aspergillus violaceofuscus CBS 115571]RAH80288.1 hypothetical protein BO86DRAFT_420208 [Aspergillus japonicus CBS 114.51]
MSALKEALVNEIAHLRAIAKDLLFSGTYIYPIKGIIYTLHHQPLWTPLLSRSAKTLTLGLGITTTMFFFTYLPQVALLTFTAGPFLAPFSAALLVLSESSTITTYLARSFLLADAITDTFDATLLERGEDALVARERAVAVPPSASSTSTSGSPRLGSRLKHPIEKLSPHMLLRSLLYLPLNFVPVVGTIAYIYVQGKRVGPVAHARYFQLKGWGRKEREGWVEGPGRRGAYTAFGMAAFALEMIPFASIVMAFTNTVGAALWAADLEKATR